MLLTKYYSGDQIKKNEMGKAYSMYGVAVHTGFWWENLREGHNLEDPGVDGRILKFVFQKWDGGMDWIDLAQDWDRWRCECGEPSLPFGRKSATCSIICPLLQNRLAQRLRDMYSWGEEVVQWRWSCAVLKVASSLTAQNNYWSKFRKTIATGRYSC